MPFSQRKQQLQLWLVEQKLVSEPSLSAVGSDAGFRRYFRFVDNQNQSLVAVDAPTNTENNRGFVAIAEALNNHKVVAPRVLAVDYQQGFMCQTDAGDNLLSSVLTADSYCHYYQACLSVLPGMQQIEQVEGYALPQYDEVLLTREFELFTVWLLQKHLGLSLTTQEQAMLQQVFELLRTNFADQPQVFVHRDFHSRNILLDPSDVPIVIDFQDAVIGPITYDAVSLLRDCYVKWPKQQVMELLRLWHKQYYAQYSWQQFTTWFDLTGIQRHLKAAGIFCRLHYRDGKSGYLADIPNTLNYVVDVASQHHALVEFAEWLKARVIPAFNTEADAR